MSKPALLSTGPMLPLIDNGIEQHFVLHRLHEMGDRAALTKRIAADVVAICTGSHTGVFVDGAMMDQFPNLKIIGNFGVGYDNVEVAAAAKRGVIITNTPDVLTEEVADSTIAVLLATIRDLAKAEQHLRDGRWPKEGEYRLTASLRDRSIGIVGMGRIGKAIGKRLEAFGRPISYHSRTRQPDVSYRYYADPVALARDVDTLIAILPGGPATEKIISATVIDALGPRGIFINLARGSVVDEKALIKALREKKILAAGLDVFLNEPNIDPELLTLENAVLYPHLGSGTEYTRSAMGQLVVDNLAAFATGKPPKTPVVETPFKGW